MNLDEFSVLTECYPMSGEVFSLFSLPDPSKSFQIPLKKAAGSSKYRAFSVFFGLTGDLLALSQAALRAGFSDREVALLKFKWQDWSWALQGTWSRFLVSGVRSLGRSRLLRTHAGGGVAKVR